jgi:hypothetical protein
MKKPQNIPTWNYPSNGTPIYRNTSEVPPKFKYGGKMYDFGGNLGAGISGVAQGIAGSLLPGPLGTMAVKGIQSIHSGLDKNMSEQEKGISGFGRAAGAIGSAALTGGASLSTGFDDIASGLATGIGGFNGNGDDQMLNTVGNLAGKMGQFMKYGGNMYPMGGQMQQGMENQLTEFNEGGSHEMNPQGGIPQGVGANGQPNLVEEGETKLNSKDYVYSDSLKLDKTAVESFNLPSKFVNKTFAEASKLVDRPNSRRENDTIENEAKTRELDALMNAQEDFKAREFEAKMLEAQTMFPEQFATMQGMFAGQGQPQAPEQGIEDPNAMNDPMAQTMGNPMEEQIGIGQEQMMKYGGNLFPNGGPLQQGQNVFYPTPTGEPVNPLDSLLYEQQQNITIPNMFMDAKHRPSGKVRRKLDNITSYPPADYTDFPSGEGFFVTGDLMAPNGIDNPYFYNEKRDALGAFAVSPQFDYQNYLQFGNGTRNETLEEAANRTALDKVNTFRKDNVATTIEPSVVNTNTPFEIAMSPRMTELQNAGVNPFTYSDEKRAKMNQAKLDFENGVIDEDTYNDIVATETGEEVINAGNVSYYTNEEKALAELTDDQAEEMGMVKDPATGKWMKIEDYKELPTSKFEQTPLNAAASLAPVAYNAAMGIATAFQKPMKLSYEDYINKQSITAPKMNVDPQLRATEQAFAAGQKGLKNVGGAAYLKSIGSLANQEAMTRSGIYANKENVDNQAKLQADTFNSQLASQNASSRFQVDDWNARAKTAKQQQMADYFGTSVNQIGQIAQTDTANKLGMMYAGMGNEDVANRFQVNMYNPFAKKTKK